jgi:hypothetical protein
MAVGEDVTRINIYLISKSKMKSNCSYNSPRWCVTVNSL